MAIQIDLLPGYVKLKRQLHRSIAACIVGTGLIASGLLLVLQQKKLDLQTLEEDRDVWAAVAAKTEAATAGKTTATTETAPLASAVTFMTSATKTGPQRAALLDLVSDYINEDTVVDSIDISTGSAVTISATVRNPDQYATFLLNLRRAADVNGGTLFKGLPTTTKGPGGFANGAVPFIPPGASPEAVPIIYPIQVVATGNLLYPIQLPAEPGGAAPALTPGTNPPGQPTP
jgi:hypothetical protein